MPIIKIVVVLAILAAACGGPAGNASANRASSVTSSAIQGVIVTSQVLVGRQRITIGVLDGGAPVNDAQVHVRAFRGSASDPQLTEADASFRSEGLEGKGIYVAYLVFAAAGQWIAELTIQRGTSRPTRSTLALNVATSGSVPSAGQPAPRSANPTRRDVADVREIDSGVPPDDMHEVSIAVALDRHQPVLIVFATPAFCTSAMCGPEVHAVQQLEPAYRDRVAFIHVEIYENFRPDPAKMRLSATVQEWRLQTEPWVFLIDRTGTIARAFEGPTATDELRAALDELLRP